MPVQKLISGLGLAKQTAKGSAQATPTWALGLLGGNVFQIPISQDLDPTTLLGGASDRFAPQAVRTQAIPGFSMQSRLFPRTAGLLLYAVSGGISSVGSAPTTHTITPAQTLPYLTAFGRIGAEYTKLQDVLIDEVTISWDEAQPAVIEAVGMGLVPSFHTASWTATNDETVRSFITPVSGTLQLDVDGGSPANANIAGASLHWSNSLEPIPLSKSELPDDAMPATQKFDGSFRLIVADFADFLSIVTGTPTGTTYSQNVIYGSLSVAIQIDSSNSFQVVANRVAFMVDWPDSDPGGGAVELTAAFATVRPTDASAAYTATVKNDVASY